MVSQSYLNAGEETGSQVSAMLLTATQQIFIKTGIPKLKQSGLVTFKHKKVKVKLPH
jgi:hypothetical protein